jgi:hypothetical protein
MGRRIRGILARIGWVVKLDTFEMMRGFELTGSQHQLAKIPICG